MAWIEATVLSEGCKIKSTLNLSRVNCISDFAGAKTMIIWEEYTKFIVRVKKAVFCLRGGLMLELVRTYLGYCSDCRLPRRVGDFKMPGWRHVLPLCDVCLQRLVDKLRAAMFALSKEDVRLIQKNAERAVELEQTEGEVVRHAGSV